MSTCRDCDRKVKRDGDICNTCRKFWRMMRKRARAVEARKKRKVKK